MSISLICGFTDRFHVDQHMKRSLKTLKIVSRKLSGLIGAYYFMNSAVTAKASTLVSTTCAIGMMVNMLQSLGIIGTMTVGWPVDLKGMWSFLQA